MTGYSMETPILEFLRHYQQEGRSRFHMPGHKGQGPLGCESLDITEVDGADSLYEPSGIILTSEQNATELFGSQQTYYGTEGSSQCVKAMLYLALVNRPEICSPLVLAARNVHRSFVHAAGLLDLEVKWLWPEENTPLCSCPVTAEQLEQALSALPLPPAAVYVTSPDYLGGMQDVQGLAETAHRHGTPLLVDNAHGAYLHFLAPPCHPLDLGADLCCDSAHKTLGVLTGGAYLHVGKYASPRLYKGAKEAMALFGSSSPSYLILGSLDQCNQVMAENGPALLQRAVERLAALRENLVRQGWAIEGQEPLKLTIAATRDWTGSKLGDILRAGGVEPEYVSRDHVVLMASGGTAQRDILRVEHILCAMQPRFRERVFLPPARGEQILSIREALFAPHETIPVEEACGRICATPTVSCPPAIPIAISGEALEKDAIALFRYHGMDHVEVLKNHV